MLGSPRQVADFLDSDRLDAEPRLAPPGDIGVPTATCALLPTVYIPRALPLFSGRLTVRG